MRFPSRNPAPADRTEARSPTAPEFDSAARELRGVLARVIWPKSGDTTESGGFMIGRLRDGSSIKGIIREPGIGLEYHLVGSWKFDGRWGWSFAFDDARPILPTTTAGVRDYLQAYAPWVGREVSREIVARYGTDTLEVLKTDPARVADEIRGITLERAGEIQKALVGREALEAVEVEVRGIVGPAGVNARQVRKILEKYGGESAVVVRANPYRLVDEIDGIGWATADRIGRTLGIASNDDARLRAGILQAMKDQEDEGHTCALLGVIGPAAAALLAVDENMVYLQISQLTATDLVSYQPPPINGVGMLPLVFRRETYEAEAAIATIVLGLLRPAPRPPDPPPEPPPEPEPDPLDWLPGPDEEEIPGGRE